MSDAELDLSMLDTYPPEYTFARQIEDILEQFNDYEAALLFEAADIKWPVPNTRAGDDVTGHPSRAQIRGAAKRMLVDQALRRDGWCSGSGFFVMKANDRLGLYLALLHGETFGEGYPDAVEGDDLEKTGESVGYFDNRAPEPREVLIEELGRALSALTSGGPTDDRARRAWEFFWQLRRSLGVPDEDVVTRDDLWAEVRRLRSIAEEIGGNMAGLADDGSILSTWARKLTDAVGHSRTRVGYGDAGETTDSAPAERERCSVCGVELTVMDVGRFDYFGARSCLKHEGQKPASREESVS